MTWGDRTQRAGTGRQPIPMNAPPAQPLSIGVQPGTSNVVRARLVVIFGSGANTGLFVYSPTPAAGNLIYSITATAGTDPYGNAYLQGATSYTAPGSVPELGPYIQQINANLVLGSNRATSKIVAGAQINLTDATVATAGPVLNLISPRTNAITGQGLAEIKIVGQSSDGTTVQPQIISDTIFAFDPNTVAHLQAESWHAVTKDAGWANAGGNPTLSYQLNGFGQTVISGYATHAAYSGSLAINGASALPSFYQPTNPVRCAAYTNAGACGLVLSTAGVISVEAAPAGSTDIRVTTPGLPLNL